LGRLGEPKLRKSNQEAILAPTEMDR